ncbi:hypothetical protein [Hydrogenophaga sp.]|uniref:hypothetical protein n=1 Tax=Hydrogenophaga sp. TaxID=1904254 RepID=UPI002717B966|nr:hypothetical protein [Hydrogenophaga sp.]MDO9434476.1 hypothetical protein [Hydrogenophaga sp.]
MSSTWTAQLDALGDKDRAKVRSFFNTIADDGMRPEPEAWDVFDILLAHEAYDVFVDLFNNYNQLLKLHTEADGKPFKSRLLLRLPQDWTPRAPVAMLEAFQRIQVDRLEVISPLSRDNTVAVPAAVCECVATLLSKAASAAFAGTTELTVSGPLANAGVVAAALAHSGKLETLVLGDPDSREPPGAAACASYEALVSGTKTATGLQHLRIQHAAFLTHLAPRMDAGLKWPALRSLSVNGCSAASAPHLKSFLQIATQSPQLAEVSLGLPDHAMGEQMEPIFNTLKTKSLARLSLKGAGMPHSAASVKSLATAILFAASCPSLTHFKWETGLRATMARHTMTSSDIQELRQELAALAKEMARVLKHPGTALQSFSMIGFPTAFVLVAALFASLADNTRLQHLDLSDCNIDIAATRILLKALLTNTTLGDVVLSNIPADFHLTDRQGGVHVFEGVRRSDGPSVSGERANFQLAASRSTGRVAPEFDAALKEHADTLPFQLYQHRRKVLGVNALPELAMNMARFMSTVLPTRKEADFKHVASHLNTVLENDGALRTAVRVTELNKPRTPIDGEPAAPETHPADVRALVALNNGKAVQLGLPAAPLELNTVLDGSNFALSEAVEANEPALVSEHLRQGALDFRGRVQRSAPKGPLRKAFLPPTLATTVGDTPPRNAT